MGAVSSGGEEIDGANERDEMKEEGIRSDCNVCGSRRGLPKVKSTVGIAGERQQRKGSSARRACGGHDDDEA